MSERQAFASLYPVDVPGAPAPSRAARRLQIGSELIFVLVAFLAGLIARSLWIVPALGLISTIAYAAQNWRLWRDTSKVQSRAFVLRSVFGTFALQTALISALYLAGLGLWTVINSSGAILGFGQLEVMGLGILLAVAIISGILAGWLDKRQRAAATETDTQEAE